VGRPRYCIAYPRAQWRSIKRCLDDRYKHDRPIVKVRNGEIVLCFEEKWEPPAFSILLDAYQAN